VIEERCDGYAFAGSEAEYFAGRNGSGDAVGGDCDRGAGEFCIGCGIIDLHEEVAAAAVDYVFHFRAVEMHRCDLFLLDDEDFFSIYFIVVGVVVVAVSQSKNGESEFVEIGAAEVGDVPAELIVSDLVVFWACGGPLVGRHEGERRKKEIALLEERFRVFDDCINLRSFHGGLLSNINNLTRRTRLAQSEPDIIMCGGTMKNRNNGPVRKNILFAAIVLIIFIAACDVVIRTVNRIYLGRQISEQKKSGGSLLDYEEMIRTGELSKGRRFAVVVGDSITFGYNLRSFKESYPFQLDKIFAYAGSGTKRMRVVTDSKPGGNTFHEMYALMHMVYSNPLSHDNPDFAVVGYCLNDAIPNFGEGLPGMVNKAKISTRRRNDLELTMANYEKRPEMVDKGFKGISKLSKERGFPVLVVKFPYIIRYERYPVGEAHEMVAKMAAERGFEVIDLRDAY